MLIYKSDACAVKYAQVDHLHSFLKLQAFVESVMARLYEVFVQKSQWVHWWMQPFSPNFRTPSLSVLVSYNS